MPGPMSRGVDKILTRVKSNFVKKQVSYETLSDDVLTMKQMNLGSKMWRRSKVNALPDDIPQGCLAVYVGNERKRFVISTQYLSHQLFKALLKKSEEEFGFQQKGGLTIACEPLFFERLLWLIGTNNPAASTVSLEELVEYYAF